MIKALILDLDDTIFPTSSIDPVVVKPFLDALEAHNDTLTIEDLNKAREALWKRPFHVVAKEYRFSEAMIEKSLEALNKVEFTFQLQPYQDYPILQQVQLEKILVTTGITKLQKAKIESLRIQEHFKEIIIDDPSLETGGKRRVFESILQKYRYRPEEVLVIGDNAESEIRAGRELGIPYLLIDRTGKSQKQEREIRSFSEVLEYLQ